MVLGGLIMIVLGSSLVLALATAIAWAGYAVVTFIAFLGPGLKFRQWVLDISPTTDVAPHWAPSTPAPLP